MRKDIEYLWLKYGGLAQLARALDLHSRGHRFDSDILHKIFFNLLGERILLTYSEYMILKTMVFTFDIRLIMFKKFLDMTGEN